MSLTDKTAKDQTEAIAFELDLKHSPDKVWRALTTPDLLAEWLLPTIGFKLEVGAEFTLKTQAYPGWDGIVKCRMIEVEPKRRISYSWTVPFLDTVVSFELTPTATGTRLSIVQSGFKSDQKQEFGGSRYGWKMMGEKLIDLLGRTS
jgi:uncharacterized protein YndB with AHSA1/START domain